MPNLTTQAERSATPAPARQRPLRPRRRAESLDRPAATTPIQAPPAQRHGFAEDRLHESLEILHEAPNYQQWLFEKIKPHLGKRVLEVGSGIGTYSRRFLSSRRLIVSDVDPVYVSHLKRRFDAHQQVAVRRLDLTRITQADIANLREERLDTIVAMNVLEHIEDDEACAAALTRVLAPAGRLVLLVPACEWLMSPLDVSYGHHRRYDRRHAQRLARRTGARLEVARYFNLAGLFGWLVNHRLLRRGQLSARQVRFFNAISPHLRRAERLLPAPRGLSMLIVLRKPNDATIESTVPNPRTPAGVASDPVSSRVTQPLTPRPG